MDPEIIKYIDYYIQNKGSDVLAYTSIAAVILSFLALLSTIYIFSKQYKSQIYDRLSKNWHDIVSTSSTNPAFFDIKTTEQYFLKMSGDDLIAYEPFCLIIWGLVEEIISLNFHKHKEFAPILQWAIAYHITWLDRNPIFFRKNELWDEINSLRKQPQSITRCSPAPMKNDGSLDWDAVSETYFEYILSPFDPLMFSNDCKRNSIGKDVVKYAEKMLKGKDSITLLDHGCGIGNLYKYIESDSSNKITVIGVDWSTNALKYAEKEAGDKFKKFIPERIDFRSQTLLDKYGENSIDIIVSIASLSLEDWESVNNSLSNITHLLKPGGVLLVLVPAFESVDEWLSLWTNYYKNEYGNEHAVRIKESWEINKKFDRDKLTYAEDGVYSQCFFTQNRLQDLLINYHGMSLESKPNKLFYPWELINRFDYGLYSDTKFELYDWYAIVKKRL